MGNKAEKLEKKYDRLVDKSNKDGLLSDKEEERIAAAQQKLNDAQKTEEASIDEQENIEKEVMVDDTSKASNAVKESISVDQLLRKGTLSIKETRKQLRFAKKGEGSEVRQVVQYINEWLDQAQAIIDKNRKYDRKFSDHDVRRKEHISTMIAKIVTLLDNSGDYISQVVTGDIDEAKKFFPPNVFDDASYYIPDTQPHEKKKGKDGPASRKLNNIEELTSDSSSVRAQFERHGAFGLANAGLEALGAPYDLRYRTGQVGNMLWGLTKVGFMGYNLWHAGKSLFGLFSSDKAKRAESFKKIAIHGGLLAGGFILGPQIEQLVKGGKASVAVSEMFKSRGGSDVAPEDTEGVVTAAMTNQLFKDIAWKDRNRFTNNDGKVDFDQMEKYIKSNEGEDSPRLELLASAKSNPEAIQKLLIDMGITGSFINNAVARNPKGTIQEPFDKTIEGAKAVTEVYDGNDKANITPTLNSIEIQLASTDLNFAFKSKKAELEKEINILHCKHPNARPIKLAYDSASKTLDLTTYGETVKLDILSGKYLVSTPYSNVTWPAASLAEAIRIANLTNFLTATYAGASDFDAPFNRSRDGVSADLEFEKRGNRDALIHGVPRQGMDISILNDSFFSSTMENNFASINDNKKGFIDFLNGFHGAGSESLWNKNSIKFKEIRDLEEKFRTQYGISYTNDIEKETRKMSWLLKTLGLKYEGLTNDEYGKCLVAIDKTLSKFPLKLLQKTKLDYLELSRNADTNGPAYGKADATTLKLLGGSIDIDVKGVQGISHLIAHEYTHNLIYKNNKVIEKRPTRESVPLENISLDTLGYITPYGSVSAEEDMCEIAGVLFNGGSVSAEYQKELGKYQRNGNLFERIKVDKTLLKKVEIFTGCKVDSNNPDHPFTRNMSSDERKAYGFEGPAFFAKRCSDAGASIDHNYWNNLKQKPIT